MCCLCFVSVDQPSMQPLYADLDSAIITHSPIFPQDKSIHFFMPPLNASGWDDVGKGCGMLLSSPMAGVDADSIAETTFVIDACPRTTFPDIEFHSASKVAVNNDIIKLSPVLFSLNLPQIVLPNLYPPVSSESSRRPLSSPRLARLEDRVQLINSSMSLSLTKPSDILLSEPIDLHSAPKCVGSNRILDGMVNVSNVIKNRDSVSSDDVQRVNRTFTFSNVPSQTEAYACGLEGKPPCVKTISPKHSIHDINIPGQSVMIPDPMPTAPRRLSNPDSPSSALLKLFASTPENTNLRTPISSGSLVTQGSIRHIPTTPSASNFTVRIIAPVGIRSPQKTISSFTKSNLPTVSLDSLMTQSPANSSTPSPPTPIALSGSFNRKPLILLADLAPRSNNDDVMSLRPAPSPIKCNASPRPVHRVIVPTSSDIIVTTATISDAVTSVHIRKLSSVLDFVQFVVFCLMGDLSSVLDVVQFVVFCLMGDLSSVLDVVQFVVFCLMGNLSSVLYVVQFVVFCLMGNVKLFLVNNIAADSIRWPKTSWI